MRLCAAPAVELLMFALCAARAVRQGSGGCLVTAVLVWCGVQIDHIIPPEARLVRLLEWLMGRLQPGAAVPQPQLPLPGLQDGLG
jgi:hypothetical protein